MKYAIFFLAAVAAIACSLVCSGEETAPAINGISGIKFYDSPKGNVKMMRIPKEKLINPKYGYRSDLASKGVGYTGYSYIGTKAEDLYLYSYAENLGTIGPLLYNVRACYTPITKKLFFIRAKVLYSNIDKLSSLLNEKYKLSGGFGDTMRSDDYGGFQRYYYRYRDFCVGDVTVFISGEYTTRINPDMPRQYRESKISSKGEITLLHRKLFEVYKEEAKNCPAVKEDQAIADKAEDERIRRIEEQEEKERQQRKFELDSL